MEVNVANINYEIINPTINTNAATVEIKNISTKVPKAKLHFSLPNRVCKLLFFNSRAFDPFLISVLFVDLIFCLSDPLIFLSGIRPLI